MKLPARKWKMYVIHHSHTDIGYTERQEKIEQYHVDFIRQALEIIKAARSGLRSEWQGFTWTCETFWPVEKFWEKATEEQRQAFVEALRYGDIDLSGTYLNLTELIDYDIMRNLFAKAEAFGQMAGIQVDSAMTADINGYSWGYSQAMADAGIRHLLSCIHTHHGMYAGGRKQFPFYWETPKGDRLLVWSGEHYMLGNDLGLCPGAVLSYSIRDEFNGNAWMQNHWEIAEERISRYLNQLEKENYPYDFGLINVMGLLRDNAAPNGAVAAFIQEWNAKHGDWVTFEMSSLSRFFEEVKQMKFEIPVYKGDWPDWWSDGIVSTPAHTQVFREAQRTLRAVKKLDPERKAVSQAVIEQAEFNLAMYAEHTWGYHSSVYEPWHPMVHSLAVRKEAYAANGSRLVDTAMDEVLRIHGEALLAPDRRYRFKVMNPSDYSMEDIAHLYLEGYEPSQFPEGIVITDAATGDALPHQTEWVSRGYRISVPVKLHPGEARILAASKAETKPEATTKSSRLKGNDGVCDMEDLIKLEADSNTRIDFAEHYAESPYVRIEWKTEDGIVSWVDKKTGRELLRSDKKYGAFTPVYEVTPAEDGKMAEVRRKMGRNRKGMNVSRSGGRLKSVKEIANGPLYGVVELFYETEGMTHYSLLIKLYNGMPRVDIGVRMHKSSVWEPENVYVALPFTIGGMKDVLWLDKAGAAVRPGQDQIPGTLLDFYCIQEGLAYLSEQGGLSIATPDSPLVQLGPLAYGARKVHGQQFVEEPRHLYSWLMTNYWETNFKATLGGFYEFRFIVQWNDGWKDAAAALESCRSVNSGILAFRTAE